MTLIYARSENEKRAYLRRLSLASSDLAKRTVILVDEDLYYPKLLTRSDSTQGVAFVWDYIERLATAEESRRKKPRQGKASAVR